MTKLKWGGDRLIASVCDRHLPPTTTCISLFCLASASQRRLQPRRRATTLGRLVQVEIVFVPPALGVRRVVPLRAEETCSRDHSAPLVRTRRRADSVLQDADVRMDGVVLAAMFVDRRTCANRPLLLLEAQAAGHLCPRLLPLKSETKPSHATPSPVSMPPNK